MCDVVIYLEGRCYGRNPTVEKKTLYELADLALAVNGGAQERLVDWSRDADGDFVALLFYKRTKDVFISNDIFGRLPLSYCKTAHRLIVSRELHFIAEFMDLRQFDRIGLAKHLLIGYPLGERTLLENVHRLQPATCIRIKAARSQIHIVRRPSFRNSFTDQQTGLIVDREDSQALAKAIALLFDHPEPLPKWAKSHAISNSRHMSNFVITGPGRSGSHMLLTALQQHPEIQCLDEIFLPMHYQQTYIPKGKLKVSEILDSLSRAPDKPIFGFAVHYNELFHSRYTNGIVDELLTRQFRIIHLIRDNLLRRFLSHRVAGRTHVWGTDGPSPSTLKIKLSAWDLFVDIKRTLDHAERTRGLFRHLPFLELSYEDLCADFSGSFDRVCKFLGASSQNLTPQTFQQENRSLREAIVNYDRLKLVFAMSKYRRFFDD